MVFVGVVVGALMTARRARLLDRMSLFWRAFEVSFRLIINQFTWIWLLLTSFRAEVCEEQEWRVGLTYVPTTACIRCGASSRKRHGNRHAKPAGLRVPVHPNLRKFLVKCSTSGGFFVNFYTLFFSTTSSVLLRKV